MFSIYATDDKTSSLATIAVVPQWSAPVIGGDRSPHRNVIYVERWTRNVASPSWKPRMRAEVARSRRLDQQVGQLLEQLAASRHAAKARADTPAVRYEHSG